jgi:hypothetical protein
LAADLLRLKAQDAVAYIALLAVLQKLAELTFVVVALVGQVGLLRGLNNQSLQRRRQRIVSGLVEQPATRIVTDVLHFARLGAEAEAILGVIRRLAVHA